MPESVSVRCPACRREHVYTAPAYPCACGTPAAPRLDRVAAPLVAGHRSWADDWIGAACAVCGRLNHWPRPEVGCPCGTVLRIPVLETDPDPDPDPDPAPARTEPSPDITPSRRVFQPHAVRTARDAVTATALYLRWLGYGDIRRADQRPVHGIGLAARGLLAQVDPTVRPAAPQDVECLWLTAMTESADCVYFSLAGYTDAARACADSLGVPLFVLDLAGVPQPVNDPAEALNADGAPEPGRRARRG
ncbi:hypothetical protein ACFYMX_18185 [Streptomyces griseofuscus]|uniref:hypothetical protein n=1 Tax=Streptomyces TaxID=1883 RepID=UPI00081F29EE|nr:MULTISPECIES: hypothetical protein [unclassified Streptomyces]MYQ92916.1 hypothetical protein [Streptomyces sp. SID4946]SCF77806.1 hypothetical protein GA0115256_117222 [Streptomyces sp. DconLS]SCG02838.1 hypothetical protein GA0115258_126141 [Streptomyces sp. LamerLS-31b]